MVRTRETNMVEGWPWMWGVGALTLNRKMKETWGYIRVTTMDDCPG